MTQPPVEHAPRPACMHEWDENGICLYCDVPRPTEPGAPAPAQDLQRRIEMVEVVIDGERRFAEAEQLRQRVTTLAEDVVRERECRIGREGEAEQLRRERDEARHERDERDAAANVYRGIAEAARAALAERERAAFMAGHAAGENAAVARATFSRGDPRVPLPAEAYAAWQATQPATPSEREP